MSGLLQELPAAPTRCVETRRAIISRRLGFESLAVAVARVGRTTTRMISRQVVGQPCRIGCFMSTYTGQCEASTAWISITVHRIIDQRTML